MNAIKNSLFIVALAFVLSLQTARAETPEKDDDAPVKRAAKPSEYGMELFSWRLKGEDTWRFALLPAPGPEKLKTMDFVTSKENTIEGSAALKKKLNALAINEKVGWFNMLDKNEASPDDKVFDFPPREIVKELELYCTVLKVRLNIYHTSVKK